MVEKDVTIMNRAGVHARPAAMLVQTANKFQAKIMLEKGNEKINGKSIMGVISLGVTYKTSIKVIAEGSDEVEALDAVVKLFESKFEENDEL